jgi:hypothetical protein
LEAAKLAVTLIFSVAGVPGAGCTVAGVKSQVTADVPVQVKETVPANPVVTFTVALTAVLPPRARESDDVLTEPL